MRAGRCGIVETFGEICHAAYMMNTPYAGFRFEYSRSDTRAPDGMLKVHYIVVERSYEAAFAALSDKVGNPGGLRLIESGLAVLNEAKIRGIADGQTFAL